MDLVQGISLLAEVAATASNAAAQAVTLSNMIKEAQAEGRTTFTDAEWANVKAMQDAARASLVTAIQKALTAA